MNTVEINVEAFTIDAADTVAVALLDIAAGASVRVRVGSDLRQISMRNAVPLGHKLAVTAMKKGSTVVKYGAAIASATHDISVGEHVHVHNAESNRARRPA